MKKRERRSLTTTRNATGRQSRYKKFLKNDFRFEKETGLKPALFSRFWRSSFRRSVKEGDREEYN
jgi:hypothetical protein